MTKKSKLRRILSALSPDGTQVDFSAFDDSVAELKKNLLKKVQAQTLADVNYELSTFQKRIDITPLISAVHGIEQQTESRIDKLTKLLRDEISAYETALTSKADVRDIAVVTNNIAALTTALRTAQQTLAQDLQELRRFTQTVEKKTQQTDPNIPDILRALNAVPKPSDLAVISTSVSQLESVVDKLRKDTVTRFANFHGGGNANRNIAVGGNTSVLSKYTDINLKPGNNVTITYTANDTTKYTDVTISATGGGGSVGGVTRSINRINTSQSAGNTLGTDYVYVCTGGVQVTLPDAVTNTNLYTIKNTAASSVLISTTGGQTIDGDANLILATQFTSVDLVNDGNNNWSIT